MKNARRNAGFTLTEMLIVITIIALIYTICLPFIYKIPPDQKAGNAMPPLAVSKNSAQEVSFHSQDHKIYDRFEDIPLPKSSCSLELYHCSHKGKYWAIIIPDKLDIEPLIIRITEECDEDLYWRKRDIYFKPKLIYTEYDLLVGQVPRGRIVGKDQIFLAEENEFIPYYFVEMELESGKTARVQVHYNFFPKVGIGDYWPPEKLITPVELTEEKLAFPRGWSIYLPTARYYQYFNLHYFVPEDGSEPYVYGVKKSHEKYCKFWGDSEPTILEDFGPIPSGKILNKEEFNNFYFLTIENEGKIRRYFTHKEIWGMLKIGDSLPR